MPSRLRCSGVLGVPAPWLTVRRGGPEEETLVRELEGSTVVAEAPEEDELVALRRQAEEQKEKEREAKAKSKSPKRKSKKSKKKEKEKDKEKKKKPSDDSEASLEVGQKRLSALFSDTGLDPNYERRKRILKKAKRIGQAKKKKKKSSQEGSGGSSTGSSSTSSQLEDGVGLFEAEKRMMTIWKRYPGVLACSAASEIRQHLVSASGAVWQLDKRKVGPVFTHYTRQCLTGHMSPSMSQEAVTVSQCLDLLAQGQPAAAMDILAQRLKALESASKGSHWSVSRQLELVRADAMAIAEEEESRQAAKRAREEEKLRRMMQKTNERNQENQGGYKGKPKGKDWKGGKGKSDGGGRGSGKGNDNKWEKKEKT